MDAYMNEWMKLDLRFDGILTGYLGSAAQIDIVKRFLDTFKSSGNVTVVDPVMGDNGDLYPAYSPILAEQMRSLASYADILTPNLTEACLLTDTPYKEKYDKEYIDGIFKKLADEGFGNIIFTGVSFSEGKTGVAILENGEYSFYEHEKVGGSRHGTGDVYASAFVGALMRGKKASDAAAVAADYTVCCIKETQSLENHWYGVAFERAIPYLIKRLKEND